ncbi:MAG: TrkH family potassium uptake protein [Saprospirales bacterium]|nr:MAG: TrkH family potassium uptake protein [Saprospirales bacterium]
MIQFEHISNFSGVTLIIMGMLMATGVPVSLVMESGDHWALIGSSVITIAVGASLWYYKFSTAGTLTRREAYFSVFFTWVMMSLASTLPYVLTGTLDSWADIIFEAVSGITTTGATIMEDIESMPEGLLYWRSMTQWIGGMGIILLGLAIFPMLGMGGAELFVAENSGNLADRIHPRVKEIAKWLWIIYLGMTAALFGILWLAGMGWYDAINHAYTTLATGGFSTKNDSVGYWDLPAIQYPIILFMILSGVNYSVLYMGFSGKLKRFVRDEEVRWYAAMLVGLTALVFILLMLLNHNSSGLEKTFRDALFQVTSILTTTGYATADYTAWTPALTMIFFIMFFSGACSGSTSGSIKLMRHILFLKNTVLEFKRIIHPRAIIPVKLNGKTVKGKTMTNIIIFLLIHIFLLVFGIIFISFFGIDFQTNFGIVGSAINNIGPALGSAGPADNYAHFPGAVKVFLAFYMLLGRLELFTVLVIFTPYFWRRN